jgi:hypothetical protein
VLLPAGENQTAESTLSWRVTNLDPVNGRVTLTNRGTGEAVQVASVGTQPVRLTQTTVFTLTACNAAGECVSAEVTVTVKPALPVIKKFEANRTEIREGETGSLTLTWDTEYASEVTLLPGPGKVPPDGNISLPWPAQTTTYTLAACNAVGECLSWDVTVTVKPALPVIKKFEANPTEIRQGETCSLTLTWDTEYASEVTLLPGPGKVPPDGSISPPCPAQTTTYTLAACNAVGECVSWDVTVTVKPLLPKIVLFTITIGSAGEGNMTLNWETKLATRVTLTPIAYKPDGTPVSLLYAGEPVDALGHIVLKMPAKTTVYTLAAYNNAGETATAEVAVTVAGP